VGGTDRGSDDGDPSAVPGLHPGAEVAGTVPSISIEVDGELFAMRPAEYGGTDYTWSSGPNEGYGFGSSGVPDRSMDEHRESIRTFLAQVDPSTGFIEDD
jgi:hypothetical protein